MKKVNKKNSKIKIKYFKNYLYEINFWAFFSISGGGEVGILVCLFVCIDINIIYLFFFCCCIE